MTSVKAHFKPCPVSQPLAWGEPRFNSINLKNKSPSKSHFLALVNKLGVIPQANPTEPPKPAKPYHPNPCAQPAKYWANDVRVRVWLGLGLLWPHEHRVTLTRPLTLSLTLALTSLKQYLRAGWNR